MTIKQLIQSVKEIPAQRGYFFVRTDGGKYHLDYIEHDYIAIGWNEIHAQDLKGMTKLGNEVKSKIQGMLERESPDWSQRKLKSNTTGVFTKLLRFKNLKKGDLVIIPNSSSMYLSFGIIQDDDIYTETDKHMLAYCPFEKRRAVKWIETKSIWDLDPIFHQIIKSWHSIFNVKKYEHYIDNATETLYIKNGYTHFVLNINTHADIDIKNLLKLINTVNELNQEINQKINLPDESNDIAIRLNLQSPGRIEFKSMGKALILCGLLFSQCASNNQKEENDVNNILNVDTKKLEEIDESIRDLEIDSKKLKKI